MRTLLFLSFSLLVCGCADEAATKKTTTTTTTDSKNSPAVTNKTTVSSDGTVKTESKVPAPDNSAVNERDRAGTSKTPIDQNENATDIKITADIRKRVVDQADFSVIARNVKIITADGKVTLRGPVATEKEREVINSIAHEVAGKENVDSQLEVAP